jgi:hypothetical protein
MEDQNGARSYAKKEKRVKTISDRFLAAPHLGSVVAIQVNHAMQQRSRTACPSR